VASKLGDVPLFSDSSLLGPSSSEAKKAEAQLEDVALTSELGLDYSALRDYLQQGDFRKADDETRALLIKMAGPGAVQRGWVYFTEVSPIPAADLQTVDRLWKAASGGKFGYSVQREIWQQNNKRWSKFFKQIDWTQGENNAYRKWPAEFKYEVEAPKGHLPLTNALRGTQLFQAVLEHPAWEAAAAGGAKKKGIDQLSQEAGKDTLKF